MSEHDEQVAVFEWAKVMVMSGRCPELALMFAIPNGGKRPKRRDRHGNWYSPGGVKMKAEGEKPGVLDMMLPVACQGYHGMFIEMKFGRNKLTPEQQAWARALAAQRYFVIVAYDAQEAIEKISRYLGIDQE